jgi:hypothetical protein
LASGAVLTNSASALKAIVIHGDGVAIMPRQLVALERQAGLLHCIHLVEAGANRALGLSRTSSRPLSSSRLFASAPKIREGHGAEGKTRELVRWFALNLRAATLQVLLYRRSSRGACADRLILAGHRARAGKCSSLRDLPLDNALPRECSTPTTTPFGQAGQVYSIGLASPHKHRKFLVDPPSHTKRRPR